MKRPEPRRPRSSARGERIQDALLTAFVAAAGCGLWWLLAGFDLATWLPIACLGGAVLGYLLGPRAGYLFVPR